MTTLIDSGPIADGPAPTLTRSRSYDIAPAAAPSRPLGAFVPLGSNPPDRARAGFVSVAPDRATPTSGRTSPLGTVAPLRAARRGRVARYLAPGRFDVHEVDSFERWVAGTADSDAVELVVDCSRIEFLDVAAIEAIARVHHSKQVTLVDLSLAAMITFRLLDAALPAPRSLRAA